MTEQELLKYCCKPTSIRPQKYWTSEIYGFGVTIRQFGLYPLKWPINIYSAHGLTLSDKPTSYEIMNDAPVIFYFSSRLRDIFQQKSSKKSYCLTSPNVIYRKRKKITKDINSQGTIAFFAHSYSFIEDKVNISTYIRDLKKLPEEYQPVTACLHYNDIKKGIYKIFQKNGIEVVTAGHPFDDLFMKRFYDIIRKYKYSTSNGFGSYLFYCVEMGIPFFLYGCEPDFYAISEETGQQTKFHVYKDSNQSEIVKKLFYSTTTTISDEQRVFVESELGIYNSISRIKFILILYWTLVLLKFNNLNSKICAILSYKNGRTGKIFPINDKLKDKRS